MAEAERKVDELRTLAGKLESFVQAVAADNEATRAHVDALGEVVDALGGKVEAEGQLVQALRDRLDSSERVYGAFKEVAHASAELATELEATRGRLDAVEGVAGKLAEALKRTNTRAAGDAARLLEEVEKLKRSVDVLSMLASDMPAGSDE